MYSHNLSTLTKNVVVNSINKIIKTATSLMNRLKYIHKFTLIFTTFSIPTIIMICMSIIQINEEIAFRKNQNIGLEYNVALRELIQRVQEYRGLTVVNFKHRDSINNQLLIKEMEINEKIRKVDSINEKYKDTLKSSQEWTSIKEQWTKVRKEQPGYDINETFQAYTELIEEMLSLNNHVSDRVELLVQPKLYRYYLTEAIIKNMPWAAEYMAEARSIGSIVTLKGYGTLEEKYELIYLENNIKKILNDTSSGMEIAFRNEEVNEKVTKDKDNAFDSAYDTLGLLTREIINKDKVTIDYKEYFNSCTKSIDKIYNLLILKTDTLMNISKEELEDAIILRNFIIIISAIVFLVIICIFYGFYNSISVSIKQIEEATSKIASGDLKERVELEARDETKKIESALNTMLDNLVANYNELQETKKTLENLALHDSLTGLPNRTLFMERLDKTIEEAKKNGTMVALLFIDLDKFKAINDNFGHTMGDIVLKNVAVQLLQIVGNTGLVCRLGGDEFTVLIPEVGGLDYIEMLSKNISDAIEELRFLGRKFNNFGASVGYAIFPMDATNSEDLLKRADKEMYKIKYNKVKSI